MMPDLVNQNVADDGFEGFVVFGPVIQNGSPVEPDQIGLMSCREDIAQAAALGEANAPEQPENIER